MRTDAEIRMQGMQALIGSLGLIEAERFLMALSQDQFDYTQWRQTGLPTLDVEQLAQAANQLARQLDSGPPTHDQNRRNLTLQPCA